MHRACLAVAVALVTLLAPDSSLAISAERGSPLPTRLPVLAAATASVLMHDGSAGADFRFEPQTLAVLAGTTVIWKNVSSFEAHTATSDTTADDPGWFVGNVDLGQSASFVFTQPGTYPYHCAFHGAPGTGMFGTIEVVATQSVVFLPLVQR